MTEGWEHKLCLFLHSSLGITDRREITLGVIQYSYAAFLL